MAVITISNEMGSRGSLIGKQAAEELGYHLADQSTIETILKDYGLVQFEEEYRSLPGFWDRLDSEKQERRDTFLKMLDKSFLALASHGDILIMGRVGFAALAGLADVLKVRIQAPLELRVEREEAVPSDLTADAQEAKLEEYDTIQKTFVESAYGVPWDASKSFDLVIDTGKIDPCLATTMIVMAARALKVPAGAEVQTAAGLTVDPVLASAVREVLKCQAEHAAGTGAR